MTDTASQPARVELLAVVTRADGTVEDLGVIATSDPAGPGHIDTHDHEEGADNGRP